MARLPNTQRCIPLGDIDNQTKYLDVAELLSITNRRMYRQNRVYRCRLVVKPTAITSATEGFSGTVMAINNTWANRRAYAMAMEQWLKAHQDEVKLMKDKGLSFAKWRDFKTKLGATNGRISPIGHKYNSSTQDFVHEALTPAAGNYDWDASTVAVSHVSGIPVEFGFNWLASDGNNFNIVEQADRIYNIQQSPDTAFDYDLPYDSLQVNSTEIDDIEFEGLQEDGNEPPYDKNILNNILAHVGTLGSMMTDSSNPAATTGEYESMMLKTPWFDAPCGFVILDGAFFADLQDMDICLEVMTGDYKGVKAPQFVDITKVKGEYKCR